MKINPAKMLTKICLAAGIALAPSTAGQIVHFNLQAPGEVNIQWVQANGKQTSLLGKSLSAGSYALNLQTPELQPGQIVVKSNGKVIPSSMNPKQPQKINAPAKLALASTPAFIELTSSPSSTTTLRTVDNTTLNLKSVDNLDVFDANMDGRQDLILSGHTLLDFLAQFNISSSTGDRDNHGSAITLLSGADSRMASAWFLDSEHSGPEIGGFDTSQIAGILQNTYSYYTLQGSSLIPTRDRAQAHYTLRTKPWIKRTQFLETQGGLNYFVLQLETRQELFGFNYYANAEHYGSAITGYGYPAEGGYKSYLIAMDQNGVVKLIQGADGNGWTWNSSNNALEVTPASSQYQKLFLGDLAQDSYMQVNSVDGNTSPDYLAGFGENLNVYYPHATYSSGFSNTFNCAANGYGCVRTLAILSYNRDGAANFTKKYLDGASAMDLLTPHQSAWTQKTQISALFNPLTFGNGRSALNIRPTAKLGDVDGDGNEEFLSVYSNTLNYLSSPPMVFSLQKLHPDETYAKHPFHSIGYLTLDTTNPAPLDPAAHYQALGDMDGNGRPEIAIWDNSVALEESTGFKVYEIQPASKGFYGLKLLQAFSVSLGNYPLANSGANQPKFVKSANGQFVVGIEGPGGTRIFKLDRQWTENLSGKSVIADLGTSGWTKEYGTVSDHILHHHSEPMPTLGQLPFIPATDLLIGGNTWASYVDPYFSKKTNLQHIASSDSLALEFSILPGDYSEGADCSLDYCGNLQVFLNYAGHLSTYQVGQMELGSLGANWAKKYTLPLNRQTAMALNDTTSNGSGLEVTLKPSGTKIPIRIQSLRMVDLKPQAVGNLGLDLPSVNCTGYANWQNGGPSELGYKAGDIVKFNDQTNSNLESAFRCRPYPNSGWCANSGYTPGSIITQWNSPDFYVWQEAWERLGKCVQ